MDRRASNTHIIVLILFCGILARTIAPAQVNLAGQASTSIIKSNDGFSQYVYNAGRGTFAWRLDLFADAIISDNITFLSNFRMQQDQVLHVDYFALRLADVASTSVNVQVGEIDLPFHNLGERRFPQKNPFFALPLMNEHATSLCASDYNIWLLDPTYAIRGDGIRLLDQGLYDLGIKAYGNIGILDYSAAVINGMISATSAYHPHGLNSHSGFGKIVRLAITPMTGLTIGSSYGNGPFMNEVPGGAGSALYTIDPNEYTQSIIGGDVEFGTGYLSVYGQVIYNIWNHPAGDLKAFGYSAEARYALTPRLSVAGRVGGISFGSISTQLIGEVNGAYVPVSYSGAWDRDILRVEGALAYHLARELLIKGIYQWNTTLGVSIDPVDNMFVIQTVAGF